MAEFTPTVPTRVLPPVAVRDLPEPPRSAWRIIGPGLVGALLVWAAVTFDPADASGLDGALRSILSVPFGQVLLTLVALGIAAFGAFCFVRARYPERT